MPSQAMPSRPMYMPRAATISPSLAGDVLVPAGTVDQERQPGAGVEPVDALQEPDHSSAVSGPTRSTVSSRSDLTGSAVAAAAPARTIRSCWSNGSSPRSRSQSS